MDHPNGDDLRTAREAAQLTQEQVAAKLGRHRTTVIAWEQAIRVRPGKAEAYLRAIRELASESV